MKVTSQYLFALAVVAFNFVAFSSQGAKDDKVEKIEVLGKVSTYRLKIMVDKARLDFYKTFNSMNTISEYKMVCGYKTNIGSKFRVLKCEPKYAKDKALEITRRLSNPSTNLVPAKVRPEQVAAATKDTTTKAVAHTIELIEGNQVLWDKYQELLKAKKELDRRKASKIKSS